jgi:putative transposase
MTKPNTTCQSGVRFRAYPESTLATTLRQWIGCQRVIYNGKVAEDRLFAAQRRMELNAGAINVVTPLDQQYAQFKDRELTPWLYEVPSQVLRNGAVRWMTSKQRQLKGLSRAPRRRSRRDFNSVLVTSELFRFKDVVRPHRKKSETFIELGTASNPIGLLPFKAHRPYSVPKQIVVREAAGQWFVSFSYEHESAHVLRRPHELAYELNNLDNVALQRVTVGLDRNVADNCIAASSGKRYALDAVAQERLLRKEVGARKHQRRLARSQKGSANRRKLAVRIAQKQRYGAAVRKDFSHKVTHDLASSEAQYFVLEALNVSGMVRRPKAKQDPVTGQWLANGRRAKAGLNKSILASCWGVIHEQLTYKAARRNKLVATVHPAYTSQECSRCGHIHPDNRQERRFVCQRCGFAAHADDNAARVIQRRGIELLRSGALEVEKSVKRIAFQRKNGKTTDGLSAYVCGADARPEAASSEASPTAVRNEAESLRT